MDFLFYVNQHIIALKFTSSSWVFFEALWLPVPELCTVFMVKSCYSLTKFSFTPFFHLNVWYVHLLKSRERKVQPSWTKVAMLVRTIKLPKWSKQCQWVLGSSHKESVLEIIKCLFNACYLYVFALLGC